jgi:hypothetical protein
MTKLKMIVIALGFIFVFSTFAAAQTPEANQPAKSYDVLLQVLVSSGGAADLPAALSNTGRKLKTVFPAANFSLTNTFMGKAALGGSFSHKGITELPLPGGASLEAPVFSEFSLDRITTVEDKIQISSFRYGMRVPIKTASFKNEAGKETPVLNYEQIGLTVNRLTLTENAPTVIGTLTTSKPNEIIVLVLTIKSDNP